MSGPQHPDDQGVSDLLIDRIDARKVLTADTREAKGAPSSRDGDVVDVTPGVTSSSRAADVE